MKKVFSILMMAAAMMAVVACDDNNGGGNNGGGNGGGNSDTYVDLGLPSGTLWKNGVEEGFYSYAEATQKYGDQLPTKEQWEELIANCTFRWLPVEVGFDMKVIGPNGNTVVLQLPGEWMTDHASDVGDEGNYWSKTMTDYSDEHAWKAHVVAGNTMVIRECTTLSSSKCSVCLVQNK